MSYRPIHLRLLNIILSVVLVVYLTFLITSLVQFENPSISNAPKQTEEILYSFDQKCDLNTVFSAPFYATEQNQVNFELPDLRNILLYYGQNRRPDANKENRLLFIGMKGSQEVVPIFANKPVYLHQDPQVVNRWSFSKNSTPTSLWAVFSPEGSRVNITVFMHDEKKEVVQQPEHLHAFFLEETPGSMPRLGIENWSIEDLRVDGSLLLRQKTCWYGQDEFIKRFGKDDFEDFIDKERLEFQDQDVPYYCYVEEGSCLLFEDNQWHVVDPSEDTLQHSLLVVRRIEDRLMNCELLSPDGKFKISFDLPKSQKADFDPSRFDMRLVGARSKTEWIVTIAGQRTTLRSDDWLLFRDKSWEKITTSDQLDEYVSGDLKGALLVLEGTEKVSNETCLVGMLYDETRSRETPVAIQPFHLWSKDSSREVSSKQKQEEDDDDDYDDDDDILDYDDDDDYDDDLV